MRKNTAKGWSIIILALLMMVSSGAMMAFAADNGDIAEIPACPYCGMDRHKFAHSRMYVEYDDGSKLGACSLHCTAIDMAVNIDKGPMTIKVGDFSSKNLIDAEKAFWVIGGDMPGVMSKRPKWAFENESAAQDFIAQHGGTLADFEQAIKASYEDMYGDTRMIREKRKMKRMKQTKQ